MRKVSDCRDFPESKCSLTIAGEEDDVVAAAALHAQDAHDMQDTPDMREQIRGSLKNEVAVG